MNRASAGLMILFVAGFAVFAYGVTHPATASGHQLDVVKTEASDVGDSSEVVDYGNLSKSVRSAFDRALETGSAASMVVASSEIDAEYVHYEGRYYRVSVLPDSPRGATFEFSLGLVGIVLSSLSTVVYLLVRRETAE